MWKNVVMETDFGERVTLGAQGRLVIPARLREELGLHAGDTLVLSTNDGRLVVETPARIIADVQEAFARSPHKKSLVEELIAERREAAAVEEAEMDDQPARRRSR